MVYSDPHPGTAASLIPFAEINCSAVARDACEVVSSPVDVLETQQIDIKPQAGWNVVYQENGFFRNRRVLAGCQAFVSLLKNPEKVASLPSFVEWSRFHVETFHNWLILS